MSEDDLAYLTPEARARVDIDKMLAAAGWSVLAEFTAVAESLRSPST